MNNVVYVPSIKSVQPWERTQIEDTERMSCAFLFDDEDDIFKIVRIKCHHVSVCGAFPIDRMIVVFQLSIGCSGS
jgi:hypothetical protein